MSSSPRLPPPDTDPPDLASALVVIAALRETVAALMVQVAQLERRLGLNSTNSSKPPTSDGLKKPPRTVSIREPSGKKPGGQPGHPGKTLCQVSEPTRVQDHYPRQCSQCGSPLDPAQAIGATVRQVFDLPEPVPLVVTEHRAHQCRCGGCGELTRGTFPQEVTAPVQYGPRVNAVTVYLSQHHLIPEDRVAEAMDDLFGVSLAAATVAQNNRSSAERLVGFVEGVAQRAKEAAVKHLDETGFRITTKLQWLHVTATVGLTYYWISPKRGSLLDGLMGIVVHDHWKPYYTLTGVVHALCNTHHLRELKALIELDKEPWATNMQRWLRRACHAANVARAQDIPLPPRLVARFLRRYDAIVATGLAFHEALPPLPASKYWWKRRGPPRRRPGHNLLNRFSIRRADVVRFLTDPRVPFTNNLAEQALRMMKVRQKISGGFRSWQGAQDFATLRSVISTAKKQNWNIIQTLTQSPAVLLSQLRIA